MQMQEMMYAVSVAHHQSFTKAAEALFVSQPALSQAIRRLEKRLGVKLFVREPNSVYPTEAGLVFVREAEQILRMTDRLSETMRMYLHTQELNIGISSFYGEHYLPKIIPEFHALCPDVKLVITEDVSAQLEILAEENRVDVSLVPFPLSVTSLACRILKEEQIYLALPHDHPYAATHPAMTEVHINDFRNERWILSKKTQRITQTAMRFFEAAGFDPNIVYETLNWATILNMIHIGEGIGFIPDVILDSAEQSGVVCYRLAGGWGQRNYAAIYREEHPKRKEIQLFIEACIRVFRGGNDEDLS